MVVERIWNDPTNVPHYPLWVATQLHELTLFTHYDDQLFTFWIDTYLNDLTVTLTRHDPLSAEYGRVVLDQMFSPSDLELTRICRLIQLDLEAVIMEAYL